MSFSPFLTAGGGVAASEGLGFEGRAGGALLVWIASSERGASSIESACPNPNPAPVCRLMPESLGRERLIPESLGSAAVTSESLGLESGVDSNSSLASSRTQLEITTRVGLQCVDQFAGRIELEVAVRRGCGNFRRRPFERTDSNRRVARFRTDEAVIGGVFLDQRNIRITGLFDSVGEAS